MLCCVGLCLKGGHGGQPHQWRLLLELGRCANPPFLTRRLPTSLVPVWLLILQTLALASSVLSSFLGHTSLRPKPFAASPPPTMATAGTQPREGTPPPIIGKAGRYTVFITPPATPKTPAQSPRPVSQAPDSSPRPSVPASPSPSPGIPPSPRPRPGIPPSPSPSPRSATASAPAKAPPSPAPPPVQVPPPQFGKAGSPTPNSAFGFFWDAVAKVQDAHSRLDAYLADWFGLNQSKYQWALNDYYESKGMDKEAAKAKDLVSRSQNV